MKRKYLLTIALVAVIIFGIVLVILQRCDNGNELIKDVVLREDGVTKEELKFYADGLHPGEDRDYTLVISVKVSGTYGIDFSFNEVKDGGLCEFIVVTISCEEDIKEYTLDELFNGQTVGFTIDISEDAPAEIHVVFTMPSYVGNEAQGAESEFTALLTADRK